MNVCLCHDRWSMISVCVEPKVTKGSVGEYCDKEEKRKRKRKEKSKKERKIASTGIQEEID